MTKDHFKMKAAKFSYMVSSADGFDYEEMHRWGNLNEATPHPAKLEDLLKKGVAMVKGFTTGGGDDGLTITLSVTIDGKTDGDLAVKGVSYEELSEFQRWLQDTGDEVVGWGEGMAKEKDKKHGWDRKHGGRGDREGGGRPRGN